MPASTKKSLRNIAVHSSIFTPLSCNLIEDADYGLYCDMQKETFFLWRERENGNWHVETCSNDAKYDHIECFSSDTKHLMH